MMPDKLRRLARVALAEKEKEKAEKQKEKDKEEEEEERAASVSGPHAARHRATNFAKRTMKTRTITKSALLP
jgi:hypothetical protein